MSTTDARPKLYLTNCNCGTSILCKHPMPACRSGYLQTGKLHVAWNSSVDAVPSNRQYYIARSGGVSFKNYLRNAHRSFVNQ